MLTDKQVLDLWLEILESGEYEQLRGKYVRPIYCGMHVDEVTGCCATGALGIALSGNYRMFPWPNEVSRWLVSVGQSRMLFGWLTDLNDKYGLTLPQIAVKVRELEWGFNG